MKNKCRYKHSVLTTTVFHYCLLHHVKCMVWSAGPSAHNHRLFGEACQENPVISTSSSSSGLCCCENYFLWPSKGLLDRCHNIQPAPASGDRLWSCAVVAAAAAGALLSCSKPCPSCRFTPLRVLLPVFPSGFHTDGRKIGERLKDLKSTKWSRPLSQRHWAFEN